MRKVRYYVYYGSCLSRQPCYNLADVNAFVAFCLAQGTPITGITKGEG